MPTADRYATINRWGNGLAVRLNKTIATTAGVVFGTPVRIVAEPGRISVESIQKDAPFDQMLAAFDPLRHGGEVL